MRYLHLEGSKIHSSQGILIKNKSCQNAFPIVYLYMTGQETSQIGKEQQVTSASPQQEFGRWV